MKIKHLLDDGYKLFSVYSGKLNSCACGCSGKYYEDGRGFKNGEKKLFELFDTEILDSKINPHNYENFNTHLEEDGKISPFGEDMEINIQISTRETTNDNYEVTNFFGYRLYLKKKGDR